MQPSHSNIIDNLDKHRTRIAVVGLGYVGLPLATLLATKFKVVGFDINTTRVSQLREGFDHTHEVSGKDLLLNSNIEYTTDLNQIKDCSVYIVTVPTPVDRFRIPDLSPLINASSAIGEILPKGAIVVYESTVYPGVTEGPCASSLEDASGLKSGEGFYLGYSPERINPGDKVRTIDKITKIVSAQNPATMQVVKHMYGAVITGGLHEAPNIKTAEAAKVIENTQRDINIAIINEFAMLFDNIGLDTLDVLRAAGTKWNFLNFKPGLVGGHCIGVDPYYLTHLADSFNFHTELMDSARRTNDIVPVFLAKKALQLVLSNKSDRNGTEKIKIAVLGLTFKEDVPDLRNTKVLDVHKHLKAYGVETLLHDPVASFEGVVQEFDQQPIKDIDAASACDAAILAVPHEFYLKNPAFSVDRFLKKDGIIIDIKGALDREVYQAKGHQVWRL